MTTPKNLIELSTPSDTEVRATRVFDAPRELIYQVHTEPKHLQQWMTGAEGWTMAVCEMNVEPGGTWRCVWRKSDDEQMELSGKFLELNPPEGWVQTEYWGEGFAEMVNTYQLSEEDGKTTLTVTMKFPTKEDRDKAMATGMTEGMEDGYRTLDTYLSSQR